MDGIHWLASFFIINQVVYIVIIPFFVIQAEIGTFTVVDQATKTRLDTASAYCTFALGVETEEIIDDVDPSQTRLVNHWLWHVLHNTIVMLRLCQI